VKHKFEHVFKHAKRLVGRRVALGEDTTQVFQVKEWGSARAQLILHKRVGGVIKGLYGPFKLLAWRQDWAKQHHVLDKLRDAKGSRKTLRWEGAGFEVGAPERISELGLWKTVGKLFSQCVPLSGAHGLRLLLTASLSFLRP
jgi:hypothetical protein